MERMKLEKSEKGRKAYLAWLATQEYYDLPQKDRVLKFLSEHGSITPMEAIQEIGIMRLGARIFELLEDGWQIINEPVTGINRYGDDTRYANYRMAA